MKFLVKTGQHPYIPTSFNKETGEHGPSRMFNPGDVVDIPWIDEKTYKERLTHKDEKQRRDLCPWGVPAGSKEATALREQIMRSLKGEVAEGKSYSEEARQRSEELERQIKLGVPAGDIR